MKLSELLQDLHCEKFYGDDNTEIKGLAANAASVKKGYLFIAYKGLSYDGNDAVAEAVKNGAAAIVCERDDGVFSTVAVLPHARAAIATLARRFYGFPDKRLKLIAVTGTNGKTTTTYMLKSIFDKNGNKTGIIGTLGVSYGDIFISPELTTPDPIFLYGVFADMVKNGVEYVFMEASAHALYFEKLKGLHFDVGIFTNCTQDHLDFFGDMQTYAGCKARLFERGVCSAAVINSDDPLGASLIKNAENCVSYGLKNPADSFAVNIETELCGTTFVINLSDELYDVKLNLPAMHNVYNALAAASCARLLGVSISVIAEGLAALERVDGRLERVATVNGAEVFVDFAHTPDGLEKSLLALKKMCASRLYCLFGCGGNRDKSKRPIMGKIAADIADFVIITSDNPRFEDPYDIISQIEEGVKSCEKKYVSVTDREVATEYALNLLEKGDILLVAGKGGENYQEVMGVKRSYSDREVILKLIS